MAEREDLDTDLTSYSLDPEDQLQPGDSLMGTGEGDEDVLDAGYSPPDSARGSYAHGVTAAEQRTNESIDERLKQEEPDEWTSSNEEEPPHGDERLGGDDPDGINADDDWIGDRQVGDTRAGRLVSPDEGSHEDSDDQAWGRDVGIDGGAASAEEAAVHVIGDDEGGEG